MGTLPMSPSLADLGFEALNLFQRVKAVDGDKASQDWPVGSFTAEAERFELWAVNLGLFVVGHGSLDYRVREAERLAQTIRRFLEELMGSLAEGRSDLRQHKHVNYVANAGFNSDPDALRQQRRAVV